MKHVQRGSIRRGFSLIELLCVMAIITVLAGLVLGPASRALRKVRAEKWADDAEVQVQTTVRQLRTHFQGKQTFPRVTLQHLETNGLVGPVQLDFLKDRRVTFIPFAGSDPDEQVVIRVQLEKGFLTDGGVLIETKSRITKPPE
jgi:prepilin-type N-terminal cleavage/methylation domain-containing protein